jgi:hypothetical protein
MKKSRRQFAGVDIETMSQIDLRGASLLKEFQLDAAAKIR